MSYQRMWGVLNAEINDIIRRTPTKSDAEPIPTVILRGFVTTTANQSPVPTVAIKSSSATYAVRLKKEIERSGLLDDSGFKVTIVTKPIQKHEKTPTKVAGASAPSIWRTNRARARAEYV